MSSELVKVFDRCASEEPVDSVNEKTRLKRALNDVLDEIAGDTNSDYVLFSILVGNKLVVKVSLRGQASHLQEEGNSFCVPEQLDLPLYSETLTQASWGYKDFPSGYSFRNVALTPGEIAFNKAIRQKGWFWVDLVDGESQVRGLVCLVRMIDEKYSKDVVLTAWFKLQRFLSHEIFTCKGRGEADHGKFLVASNQFKHLFRSETRADYWHGVGSCILTELRMGWSKVFVFSVSPEDQVQCIVNLDFTADDEDEINRRMVGLRNWLGIGTRSSSRLHNRTSMEKKSARISMSAGELEHLFVGIHDRANAESDFESVFRWLMPVSNCGQRIDDDTEMEADIRISVGRLCQQVNSLWRDTAQTRETYYFLPLIARSERFLAILASKTNRRDPFERQIHLTTLILEWAAKCLSGWISSRVSDANTTCRKVNG